MCEYVVCACVFVYTHVCICNVCECMFVRVGATNMGMAVPVLSILLLFDVHLL